MTLTSRSLALPLLALPLLVACSNERLYDRGPEEGDSQGTDASELPEAVSEQEGGESAPGSSAPDLAPAPFQPDGPLKRAFISGHFGPAGEVADEAQIFDTSPPASVEGPVQFSLEALVPSQTSELDALVIFATLGGALEDLGGPGSRHTVEKGAPFRLWLCAVELNGSMVFDDAETRGTIEVHDAGSGLLEVSVTAVGEKGAAVDFSFVYEPDLELLLGAG